MTSTEGNKEKRDNLRQKVGGRKEKKTRAGGRRKAYKGRKENKMLSEKGDEEMRKK